ncbi:DUF2285 domain-containing protein [Gluconobacter sp. Gdi]|jgi:hypothetical protein|uniref:DUF2285 domain-containing protein n=1 Tax=Gluconobacter sp. Gdi TaxID=2691888 RepID=UPI001758F805|nr:DUF2285 domain-containing protein [Gluconobacter sp. Gdi]GFE97672.1 hypothetical protein DmGdi_27450 [Gluconobacter sp. Gdi]
MALDPRTALWTVAVSPAVIAVVPLPTALADAASRPLSLARAGLPPDMAEEVLTERGETILRLYVLPPDGAPVGVLLPLDALFEVRVQAALRLWRVLIDRRPGRDPARLSSDRIRRLILALRTLDGLDSGVSQREIGGVLFGREVSAGDWLSHDLHFRMKRLVQFARALRDGEYRRLLLHPFRGR